MSRKELIATVTILFGMFLTLSFVFSEMRTLRHDQNLKMIFGEENDRSESDSVLP